MGRELLIKLRVRDLGTKTLAKMEGRIQRFGKTVSKTFNSLLSLRNAIGVYFMFRIGKSFIDVASSIEKFRTQLMMVSDDAKQADQALAAIREFARTSPLETEDVVKAYVRLRAVGIDPTIEQMKTLGGVALLFNTELSDMLNAFIGMNKRTLRQYGIEIDRTGKQAVIASGKIRIETAKDAASIRQGLLQVWEQRFPDAINKASGTFAAKVAIIKSNIWEMQAALMDDLMPGVHGATDGIKDFSDTMMERFGIVRKTIVVLISTLRILWNALKIIYSPFIAGTGQAIIALKALVKTMYQASQIFNEFFIRIGKGIKAAVTLNFGEAKDVFSGFGEFITSRVDSMKTAWSDSFSEMQAVGSAWAQMTKQDAQGIADAWKAMTGSLGRSTSKATPGLPGTGATGANVDEEGGKDKLAQLKKNLDAQMAMVRAKSAQYVATIKNQFVQARAEAKTNYENDLMENQLAYDMQLVTKENFEKRKTELEAKYSKERVELAKAERDSKMQAIGVALSGISSMLAAAGEKNKAFARAAKAVAYAEAVWNTYVAANKALASYPPPFNYVAMGGAIAAGIANAIQISSQSFASGTRFAPGGPAYVHRNEQIYLPRGSQVVPASQNQGGPMSVNLNVAGNIDKSNVGEVTNSLERLGREIKAASRAGYIKWQDIKV